MNSDDENGQNATSSNSPKVASVQKQKGKGKNAADNKDIDNLSDKEAKVLFQHEKFSVHLHEYGEDGDVPYIVQVCLGQQKRPSGRAAIANSSSQKHDDKTVYVAIPKHIFQAPPEQDGIAAHSAMGVIPRGSPRAEEQHPTVQSNAAAGATAAAEPKKGKRARKRERARLAAEQRQQEEEEAAAQQQNTTGSFNPQARVNPSKGVGKGGAPDVPALVAPDASASIANTTNNVGKGGKKGMAFRGFGTPEQNRLIAPSNSHGNWIWLGNEQADQSANVGVPQLLVGGEDTSKENSKIITTPEGDDNGNNNNNAKSSIFKPPNSPAAAAMFARPPANRAPVQSGQMGGRPPTMGLGSIQPGQMNVNPGPMAGLRPILKMNNMASMNLGLGMGMAPPLGNPMANPAGACPGQQAMMPHQPPPPPPPAPPAVAGAMGSSSNMDGADDSNAIVGQYGDVVNSNNWRVQWTIPRIHEKLASFPKGTRIFSPEFTCGGINKLGLVFYPSGNSNAKNGYCSLGLKAPHGMHLRYKLFTGNTERHTELRQNVTESWGFVDMCRLDDELSCIQNDALNLGVEIIDDIDKFETLGKISASKVEWNIRNMQTKLKHYKKDIALYSDEFSAAGIDHLRLKFYPAGKKDADEGWCSLYLEAPKGSVLRCRLSVGKKSMSFDRLEKFGEDSIWGFLTLCKLKDEMEEEGDLVRVGLEVLETKRLDQRLSEQEDAFLRTLSSDRRANLLTELDRMEKQKNGEGNGETPSRFKILELELPDSSKTLALSKIDSMNSDVLSGESSKLKKWIDGLLSIPFGNIRKPIVTSGEGVGKVRKYLNDASDQLDKAVFGHAEPKEKILQILCQWIANPESMSLVLGIQGPPGNGKTTLCRKGIAEALGRPFVQISLGGATDASVLEGHSYTYVGSSWGRIAGLMMDAKCMNPVIFFDELDKVSETARGEEIVGVLTHVTDHSQNNVFHDRYFEGVPIDLSKCLFVFSFNDIKRINPVLRDRLTVIHTKGFEMDDKVKIAQNYLLPELLENVKMPAGSVVVEKDEILYLCRRRNVSTEDGGVLQVRGLKQALECVVLHLNKLRLTESPPSSPRGECEAQADSGSGGNARGQEPFVWQAPKLKKGQDLEDVPVKLRFPVKLTTDLIDRLVRVSEDQDAINHRAMFI